MEKENRYTSKYPHRESPLENLRMIRRDGMDAFWSMSGSIGHARTVGDRFRFTTGIVRTVGKECLAQMPRQVLVLLAFSDDDRIRLEHS